MPKVILVSDSDSEGYKRYLLDGPVGTAAAGEIVTAELADGETFEIVVHGQRELDIPGQPVKVEFPDGSTYKPK